MTKNKTVYKLKDGGLIIASSSSEFLTNLKESSLFDSDCSDAEYMIHFAKRCEIQTGAIIRTDTCDNFIKDLEDTGYIE